MRIGQTIVRPLVMRGEHPAFRLMQLMYELFNDENAKFWNDFADYALNGYVRISPTAMAFAKPCRDEEGEYWFIRAAIGELPELLAMLPSYLPRICFCRNNSGELRMYKTDRLIKLATKQLEKGKKQWVAAQAAAAQA